MEGLKKILSLRASLNLGLSKQLKIDFPDLVVIPRPSVEPIKNIDLNWVAGFTTGEGSFLVKLSETSKYKTGTKVKLIFQLTQHSRDNELMQKLVSVLGCGVLSKDRKVTVISVSSLSDLYEKIIPLFNKHPIKGAKALDFADFRRVVELMINKSHLTEEGIDQIRSIQGKMNRSRDLSEEK